MEQLDLKIEELEKKLDKLQRSIDKLIKIFFWTIVVTGVLFILPLIGLVFVIPQLSSTYSTGL